MNTEKSDPAGEAITRIRTKKLRITIHRTQYVDRHGRVQYSRGWYYRRMVLRKTGSFPLGVRQRSAEKLAEEIESFLSIPSNTLEMAQERYNPRAIKRAEHIATVGECLEAYRGALGIIGRKGNAVSAKSFDSYRSFLLIALRKVSAYRKGKPFESFMGQRNVDYSPWLKSSTSYLTAKWVMDLKLACLPPPPEGEEEPDEEEVLTAKITADTTLRSARAFFSERALQYYTELGLRVADLSGFLREPDFGAKRYFQILPPDVIVPIMLRSLELRMADQDAYRAFLLCMHCGLRKGEALAFRPSWIRQDDRPTLYVTIRGTFSPKHGHGRKVTLEPWVADVLSSMGPVASATALDRLSGWIKELIPADHRISKPLHELRKCWTSAKAKSGGLLAAQQQAGHRDPKTTTTSYADNQMADWLMPLWREKTDEVVKLPRFRAA